MKKILILILIWFVIASFFYAAIWTYEENTLSECFLFSGFVAIVQIILTCVTYPLTQIENW